MSNPSLSVLRGLRSTLNADGPTDAELLSRYASERDAAAFELLVWRYAGLVLSVCRAVTRDHHAAEDATQATFLALARKAASVRHGDAVPGWLTRVARRVAVRAAKRVRPAAVCELNALPARPDAAQSWDESGILHDELARLPERFRVPILLCFFDGLTHEEAARRLDWPVGTVASRIDRGKAKLQRQLTRRGVLIPAVAIATIPVTSTFVSATTRAATAFALGNAADLGASPTVLTLANGAIRTMTISKLQWTAGLVAACGMFAVSGVWAANQAPGGGAAPGGIGAAPVAAAPAPADPPPAAKPLTAGSLQRKRSLENLKQIILAIHNYHESTGRFPCDIRDAEGKPLLSWRVAILPYMEQANLYRAFKLDEPWDSEHNLTLSKTVVKIYHAGVGPKDSSHTYYQTFSGPGAAFDPKAVEKIKDAAGPGNYYRSQLSFASVTDGTSNTIAVVEAGPPVVWTKPADIAFDEKKPLTKLDGPFANALHVAAMDGSTYALKRSIEEAVFKQMVTRAGGEVVPAFSDFKAKLPAETPEERAELRKMLAENLVLIQRIEAAMKENIELLKQKNGVLGDLGTADEQLDGLKRLLEGVNAMNKQIRDDLGMRKGPPETAVPKKDAKKE